MAFPSIKLKKEFDLLYRKGKICGGSFFSLRVLEGREKGPTKFGIVISTKISKKATERNKKRRQLKEIIRLYSPEICENQLALIVLKDEGLEASYEDLEKEFLFLLKKAKIMK